jgi:hypothetical protein
MVKQVGATAGGVNRGGTTGIDALFSRNDAI